MYTYTNGFNHKTALARIKKYNHNAQSVDEGGDCVYENADTLNRCFIGCFLPDGCAAFEFANGESAGELLSKFPELKSFMPFTDIIGLNSFQNVHDRSGDEDDLYQLAEDWLTKNVQEAS